MKEARISRSLKIPLDTDKDILELAKNEHSNIYSNAAIRLLNEGIKALKKSKKRKVAFDQGS